MKHALVTMGAVLLSACDFAAFEMYQSHTPVVALNTPEGYPSLRFAEALAPLSSDADGDWLLASGGLGTSVVAMPLAAGAALLPPNTPARYVCGADAPCNSTRTGVALAGVARWDGSTLCGMTGEFGVTHHVHVRCLGGTAPRAFDIAPPAGFEQAGFGLALAAPRPRRAGDPAVGELVFVGAPTAAGRVFAAQPAGVTDVSPPGVPTTAALGEVLAAGRIPTTPGGPPDLLLVAGAPGVRAVYVLRGDPRAGRAMTTLGCVLRSDEPGFGGAVAVGDVDGDGGDDVIVGARAGEAGRRPRVHVFLTSRPPTNASCDPAAWPEAALLECAEVPGRGAQCADGAEDFGAALAAGDLDADGRDEVLIGAPRAAVNGVEDAGAVWVARNGGAAGLALADVLRDASPSRNAMLGAAVIATRIAGRDEAIAGAGGDREALLFLCSGLDGDRPNAGGRGADCRQ